MLFQRAITFKVLPEMLHICKLFFESLNFSGIRYCHWKSNSHLRKALEGKTDLDLLVHQSDKGRFDTLLEQFGFKRIYSPRNKQFPGMEDYLGFDDKTGGFIHLHLHYRLVLGQRFIKNHHLPIEKLIFDNLIKVDGVYIPCYELELLLLVIRAHLKADIISIIKHGIKGLIGEVYTAFPVDIEDEFRVLIKKSNMEKLEKILGESELPLSFKIYTQFASKFVANQLRFSDIVKTQMQILFALKEFRRHSGLSVFLKYLYFYLSELPGLRKIWPQQKKTLGGKGKIFSLVGADGAGKSTLIKDLDNWLSWKLEVRKYYYGIPKTFLNKCLFGYSTRIFSKLHLHFVVRLIEYYFWITIARNRYLISIRSKNDTKQGKIVITDRFPLKEFHNMPEPMDGPRLFRAKSRLGVFLAKREAEYYEKIKLPDRIFVLQVSIDELRRRKTDLDISTHLIKTDAVNKIRQRDPISLIDASMPYEHVKLAIKRKIWELL